MARKARLEEETQRDNQVQSLSHYEHESRERESNEDEPRQHRVDEKMTMEDGPDKSDDGMSDDSGIEYDGSNDGHSDNQLEDGGLDDDLEEVSDTVSVASDGRSWGPSPTSTRHSFQTKALLLSPSPTILSDTGSTILGPDAMIPVYAPYLCHSPAKVDDDDGHDIRPSTTREDTERSFSVAIDAPRSPLMTPKRKRESDMTECWAPPRKRCAPSPISPIPFSPVSPIAYVPVEAEKKKKEEEEEAIASPPFNSLSKHSPGHSLDSILVEATKQEGDTVPAGDDLPDYEDNLPDYESPTEPAFMDKVPEADMGPICAAPGCHGCSICRESSTYGLCYPGYEQETAAAPGRATRT